MSGDVLVGTVLAVGVLHTLVPDHWAPIAALGRARRWSSARTAAAAALAGLGHVASTLLLGVVLYVVGALAARRYAHVVSLAAALALIAFGCWMAWAGWREAREDHAERPTHVPPRTMLLLVLGSSPMVEGIPAFLAASTRGPVLLATMALAFGLATIVTYVVTSVASVAGLNRVSLGAFERYGEFLSGLVVAVVGAYSLLSAP